MIQTPEAHEQQTQENSFGADMTVPCQVLSLVTVNTKISTRKSHLGEEGGTPDMHAGVQKWNALDFSKLKVNFQ